MKLHPRPHPPGLSLNPIVAAIVSFILICVFQSCKKQDSDQIIELPMTYHDGYGPFDSGFSLISPENVGDNGDRKKPYELVTGIPKNWSHVRKGLAHGDFEQFAFQNFKAGKISRASFESILNDQGSMLDTNKLSSKPIRCVVNVIWGVDESGNWAVMVDTNNNLDFSDETPFEPETIKFNGGPDCRQDANPHLVTFEALQKGRIISYQAPIVIKNSSEGFLYDFPRHATSSLTIDGKEYKIFIQARSPSFAYANIAYRGGDSVKPLTKNQLIEPGKNIELGNLLNKKKYKNLGVDWYNQKLKLQGIPPDKVEYILQEGYQLRKFEGTEFTTGKKISSGNMKGKYVFIDFWGTWCKGCVQDIPNMNKLYSRIDKSKIVMLGVVAQDDPKRLKAGIEKYKIQWPQLLSSENGDMIKKFNVSTFPYSVLTDKNGEIIAVDLRSFELEKQLEELKLLR